MKEQRSISHVVIPPEKARQIVSRVEKAYLRACVCREKEKGCPTDWWEVCLLFDNAPADDLRDTREISSHKAHELLSTTAERGSVYRLFFWKDDHSITELCSCCNCCCSPHRKLMEKGNFEDQLRSPYLAVTDEELCLVCGDCINVCPFDARSIERDEIVLDEIRCFGCGRCLDECPQAAIQLESFEGRGMDLGVFD